MPMSHSQIHQKFEKRIRQIMGATDCGRRAAAEQIQQEDSYLYHQYMAGKPPDEDDDDRDDDEADQEDDADEEAATPVRPTKKGEKPKKKKQAASAIAEWDACVADKRRQGLNGAKARSAVDRERPGLRLAAIAEANETGTMRGRAEGGSAAQSTRQRGNSKMDFGQAIAAKMAANPRMRRDQAVREVAAEHPDLRQALVDSANANRPRR